MPRAGGCWQQTGQLTIVQDSIGKGVKRPEVGSPVRVAETPLKGEESGQNLGDLGREGPKREGKYGHHRRAKGKKVPGSEGGEKRFRGRPLREAVVQEQV